MSKPAPLSLTRSSAPAAVTTHAIAMRGRATAAVAAAAQVPRVLS
jgi:hypothetical protein